MSENSKDNERFESLCAYAKEGMETAHIPGVALGIYQDGVLLSRGLGITNVEHPLPVTSQTLFQIGSITKTFVALLVLRLCEAGQLSLSAPVKSYLPTLRLADQTVETQLNIGHLLSHSSGWAGDWFADFGRGDDALAKIVDHLWQLPQLAPCGQFFAYNNAGFYLLGRICEVVTGQSFEALLYSQVIAPLGLTHAYLFPDEVLTHRYAVGHHHQNQQAVVAQPWGISRALYPAGGLIMDIPGLLHYAQYFIAATPAQKESTLPGPAALSSLFQPRIEQGPAGHSLGLSWFIEARAGLRLHSHEGGTNGQTALLLLVPERKFAFAMFCNAEGGERLCRAARQWALQHYLGIDEPQVNTKEIAPETLKNYAGHYQTPMAEIILRPEAGHLSLQLIPKSGFPESTLTPAAAEPAVPLVFYDRDHAMISAGWGKGLHADFLRDKQGEIGWFRCFSRLYPVVGGQTL